MVDWWLGRLGGGADKKIINKGTMAFAQGCQPLASTSRTYLQITTSIRGMPGFSLSLVASSSAGPYEVSAEQTCSSLCIPIPFVYVVLGGS